MADSVRAKFNIHSITEFTDPAGCGSVHLLPVTCGSPENERFFKYTPSGEIAIATVNPTAFEWFREAFKARRSIYVDFNVAPDPAEVDPTRR